MNFQPDLAAKVMSGRKTVTRRLVSANPRSPWYRERCSLVPGRTYAVCPGRGKPSWGRVRVLSVRRELLGEVFGWTLGARTRLGDVGALREGFEDAVAFKLAWLKINGSYAPEAEVWRVEFEVAEARLPRSLPEATRVRVVVP